MINEIIKRAQKETLDDPNTITDYLVKLSAYLWHAGNEIIKKEVLYAQKWTEMRQNATSDKQTDQLMKATEEYREWKEAVLAENTVNEVIKALKYRVKTMANEFNNGN